MSKVVIQGNASGTGDFTIAAPNSNTNRTLTLPDATGTLDRLDRAGNVLQVINFTTGAVASGTTTIPIDDTIPQNTEGNEYMSLAFTPVSATSNLKIDIVAQVWNNTSSAMSAALFQDSITSAIGAVFRGALPSSGEPLTFTVYVASASTSTRTYKVRVGSNAASTTTFNGTLGNRMFGGVMASSITIMEIAA